MNNLFTTHVLRHTSRLFVGLAIAASALAGMPARPTAAATTFMVTQTTDAIDIKPGDGLCDSNGAKAGNQCTLRAAIIESNKTSGDKTILLPQGTYMLTLPGAHEFESLTGGLDIAAQVAIKGSGRAKTIIDGNNLDSVFRITTGYNYTVSMENLTIQRGNTVLRGGAIFQHGPSVVLNNVALLDNKSGDGGAIDTQQGTLTMTNSVVSGNTVTSGEGGGIFVDWSGWATIKNTLIQNNSAFKGGGISHNNEITVIGSTIRNNSAYIGGGIFSNDRLDMSNSTVSGNTATVTPDSMGGGIASALNTSNSKLSHVTITGNRASTYGGGILNIEMGEDYTVTGSIIAGNTAGTGADCYGKLHSNGSNLLGKLASCDINTGAAGDLFGANPMLGALQLNGGPTPTHALQGDSPAIDAVQTACPATDQRGNMRPLDGNGDGTARCDIGAYEYSGPIVSAVGPTTKTAGSGAFTLTVTGKQFSPTSNVYWNGEWRETQFVNSTTLKAQITAEDTEAAQDVKVQVVTPGATLASGVSTKKVVSITSAVPLIVSTTPTTVKAGSAGFTLVVSGRSFVATSTLLWNGKPLVKTYSSPTQIKATVPASLVSQAGTAKVTVTNDIPGGGTSNVVSMTITP